MKTVCVTAETFFEILHETKVMNPPTIIRRNIDQWLGEGWNYSWYLKSTCANDVEKATSTNLCSVQTSVCQVNVYDRSFKLLQGSLFRETVSLLFLIDFSYKAQCLYWILYGFRVNLRVALVKCHVEAPASDGGLTLCHELSHISAEDIEDLKTDVFMARANFQVLAGQLKDKGTS